MFSRHIFKLFIHPKFYPLHKNLHGIIKVMHLFVIKVVTLREPIKSVVVIGLNHTLHIYT